MFKLNRMLTKTFIFDNKNGQQVVEALFSIVHHIMGYS